MFAQGRPRFLAALAGANAGPPPVWLMRQAGRYHAHYQALRKQHGFVELCKQPALAAEVALGPVDAFGFDAAILFSDILFPLEVLGCPLVFDPGPKLGFHLRELSDLARYVPPAQAEGLAFQQEGLRRTRARLPGTGLIGFVGAPLTLYSFAVEGSHKKGLDSARAGLRDGRFTGFMEKLLPLLLENMALQGAAEPDALALFDSCAGDFALADYQQIYLPFLRRLLEDFARRCPQVPVIYYGKGLGAMQWRLLGALPITVLGIDHHQDLLACAREFGGRFRLQGNFDPAHLTLPPDEFRAQAEAFFSNAQRLPPPVRAGWVCGLGHGVTPQAREENVRAFVQRARAGNWA